jgi:hypothetical protein
MYNTLSTTTSLANTSPTEEQIVTLLREYWSGERKVALKALKGGDHICVYEDEEGNRCVIGNFLPEKSPLLAMEKGVYTLLAEEDNVVFLVRYCSLAFLEAAQKCHDSLNPDIYTSNRFINALKELKRFTGDTETKKLINTLIEDVEKEP